MLLRAALRRGARELLRTQHRYFPRHRQATPDAAGGWVPRAAELFALAIGCFALEMASHHLQFAGTRSSPLCPVSGFALAAVYRCGYRANGGIFLGVFCASLAELFLKAGAADPSFVRGLVRFFVLHPLDLFMSAARAAAYVLEGSIGASLIVAIHPDGDVFDGMRGFIVFCLGALVASAVGSGIVVTARHFGSLLPEAEFNPAWMASWLRHFVGMLFLFPFIVSWWQLISLRTLPANAAKGFLALLALLVLTQIATNTLQASIFVFPLLLFIVLRFDTVFAATAVVIVSLIAVVATEGGQGLFARPDINESVFLVQRLVFVVAFTAMLLSATLAERRRALAESESALNRFQVLFKSVPNGLIAVDESGLIVHLNQQIERMFGYDRGELVGSPIEILVPEAARMSHGKLRQRYFQSPRTRPMGAGRELHGLRKDGSEFPLEIGLAGCQDSGGTLILASVVDITERRESERQHQALLRNMMQAIELERLRLARELHDETGQSVTAVMLELKQIEKESDETGRTRVRRLRDQLDSLGKSLHRIAWELRPASLDELGLKNALANYLSHWMAQSGIRAVLHCPDGKLDGLDDEMSTIIYRVIQEALTNVAKHATGATSASVVVDADKSMIRLTIEDNGCGFDASQVCVRPRGGLGLAGMRERVSLVRGELEIESAPERGTTLVVRVPRNQALAA